MFLLLRLPQPRPTFSRSRPARWRPQEIARRQRSPFHEHAAKGLAQHLRRERAPASVVALRDLAERVRAGEAHAGAHRLPAEAPHHSAANCPDQSTQELRPACSRYCEVRPTPIVPRKILDMTSVKFKTMRLADAIDEL